MLPQRAVPSHELSQAASPSPTKATIPRTPGWTLFCFYLKKSRMDPITVLLSRKLFCHKQRTDTGWSRRLRQVKVRSFCVASFVRNVTAKFGDPPSSRTRALAADLDVLQQRNQPCPCCSQASGPVHKCSDPRGGSKQVSLPACFHQNLPLHLSIH